jgi:hypothetical protein
MKTAKHCIIKITFQDNSKLTCTYYRTSSIAALNQAKRDFENQYSKIEYLGTN